MSAVDDGVEITLRRFVGVETASIEFLYVGIVDNPSDVTICMIFGVAYTVHSCARHNTETSAGDVTLGIVVADSDIGTVETREVELVEVTACNRHG